MDQLILLLTIFGLAVFVGFEIITKIPPTLHTPLMSGSNAISGITVTGAVLALGCSIGQGLSAFSILAFSAPVVLVSIILGAVLGLKQLVEGAAAWK